MDWDDILGNLDATLRLRLLFLVHNCVQIPHNSTIRLEILAAGSVDSSVGAPTTYFQNSLRRPGTNLEEFRYQQGLQKLVLRHCHLEERTQWLLDDGVTEKNQNRSDRDKKNRHRFHTSSSTQL